MQAVQPRVKREERRDSETGMAIADDMDSDSDSDDSVIIVPYVKPLPPVISLEESGEEELDEEPTPPQSSVSNSSDSISEIISSETAHLTFEEAIGGTPEVGSRKKKKSKTKEVNARKADKQGKNKEKSSKKKKKGNNKNTNASNDADQNESHSGSSTDKPNKKKSGKKKDKSKNNKKISTDETILNGTGEIPVEKELTPAGPKEITPGNKRKKRSASENDSSSSSPTKKGAKNKNADRRPSELDEPVQVLGHAPCIYPKKKRRRKNIDGVEQPRNLTPADIDHLNFLKTLNLTGNIGLNENDLLNLALSPADFGQPSLSSLIDTPSSTPVSIIAPVSSTQTGEHMSNHDETSSISSVSSDATVAAAGPVQMQAIPESLPDETTRPLKKTLKETPSKSPGYVSVVEEKSKSKKKSDLSSPKPVAAPKSVTAPKSDTTMDHTGKGSDDETDRVGIFTAEELNEVRTHLQFNVTGIQGLPTTRNSAREVLEGEVAKTQPDKGSKDGREIISGKRKNDSDGSKHQRKKRKSEGEDSEDLMRPPKPRPKATKKSVNTSRLMKARSYPSTWTTAMIDFYGKVDPQVPDVDEILARQSNSPRIWRIPVDMEPYRLKVKHFKCDNCNQFGTHPSNRCPEPRRQHKCVMCGQTGHETGNMYPTINQQNLQRQSRNAEFGKRSVRTSCNKIMCLNCGKNRSRSNKSGDRDFVQRCDACSKSQTQRCVTCDGRHSTSECPDIWRRFHSVCVPVDEAKLQKFSSGNNVVNVGEPLFHTTYRPKEQTFCCNCATRGHNYYQCKEKTGFNSAFSAIKPLVQVELPLSIVESSLSDERVSTEVSPAEDRTSEPHGAKDQVPQEKQKYTGQSSSLKEANQQMDSCPSVGTSEILLEKAPPSDSPVTITIDDDIEIIELDSETPKKALSDPKTVPDKSSTMTSPKSSEKSTGNVTPNRVSSSEKEVGTLATSTNAEKIRSPSVESNVGASWRIDRNPRQPDDKQRSEERSGSSQNRDAENRRSKSTPPTSGDHRKGSSSKDTKGKDHNRSRDSHCRDFPDCQNIGSKTCLRITLNKSDHKLVVKFDQEKRIVEKLNELYCNQGISICLRKHAPEFHIAGEKNYLPRDRILRLVKDLELDNISSLLPGVTSSSSKDSKSSKDKGKDNSASAGKDKSTSSTNCNSDKNSASTSKERSNVSTTKERNSPGETSDSASISRDAGDLRTSKDNQESTRSREANVKDVSVSSTTSEGQTNNLIQKVVFDPKSLQEFRNPPSIEELSVVSPPMPVSKSSSAKETLPAKDKITSTSDESEKRSSAPLSNYAFERKLRKLVCSVPLNTNTNLVEVQDNSEPSGKVTSSTDSLNRSASQTPATNTSSNKDIPGSKPVPKPLFDTLVDNSNDRNFHTKDNIPKDRRNPRTSRFDNRNDNNFNRNQNQFGDPARANYYNNFNPPDYNYPKTQYANTGAPMGCDVDERNLSFEERNNQFMNPNSPFYYTQPWQQNNYPGRYGPPPGPAQQQQFNNYGNDEFYSDNFNYYRGYNGPQNFDNFFIDRQPTYPQGPNRDHSPMNHSASFRSRGRARGRGLNNNNNRRR